MAEQRVQFHLAQYRPQSRLRKLRSLVNVVGHLDRRVIRIHYVERHYRVHFDGHVVAGDHVLRRNLQHLLAKRNAHHLVKRPENKNDARSLRRSQHSAQAEDDPALILSKNLDGIQ